MHIMGHSDITLQIFMEFHLDLETFMNSKV